MKTSLCFLALFSVLGILAFYSDRHDMDNVPQFAPNVTSHCVQSDEGRIFQDSKFKAQIASIENAPIGSEAAANKALW